MNLSQPVTFNRREWLYVAAFIVVVLVITAVPYLYAYISSPPDKHFMGIAFNIPDHFQYLSWMRESRTHVLVSNQLTPEYSAPLLFNFLWWTLGRIEALTGLDYALLYQITRLAAGAFVMVAIYWFCGLIFEDRRKRWTAFLVAALGSGLGWIWVIDKQLSGLAELRYNFDVQTSEPNTFFTILAFPHFAIATGLITVIFGLVLLGQRSQRMRFAWAAGVVSLLLSLQHSYDMFTIYGVIGLYFVFLWLRDRKFPTYMFKLGIVVGLISVWPALQAFYITTADEVWRGVLSQFDNAEAWTPNPLHLPILMGIGWLLAIWALDIRTPWRERDNTHLFLLAWFLAHFLLIYLPLNFQIHLLSGWQVVIGVLATIGLYNRVLPWLQRRFQKMSPQRLARYASIVLVLVVIPTNLYIMAWRLLDLRRADNPYYLLNDEVAALNYLEGQVTSEDVVLASLNIGQFVPALTGARAFLGHWAQTLDFYGKDARVTGFFNTSSPDNDRLAILREYSVDYVFYSPQEAALGDYDPASASFLDEVYANDNVRVYAVSPEVAAG
jgi:hypothetical protein